MTGDIFGYEWGYTCPDCGIFHDLSGMPLSDAHPIVNGEETVRTRSLEPGDEVACAECGHTITLEFVPAQRPDNLQRAIDVLHRQHYPDVAQFLEHLVED
jgi:hypothetical protein